EVLPTAMQHHRDLRIPQDREERRQVRQGRGVQDRAGVVGRHLDDAERRPVGSLPDELGVQGEPAGGTRLVGKGGQLAVGGQELGSGRHGAPQLPGSPSPTQPATSGAGAVPRAGPSARLTRDLPATAGTMADGNVEDFRRELRAWLEAHVPDHLRPENAARLPDAERLAGLRAWQKTLAGERLVGIHWPREYGGRDAGIPEQIAYVEEMARARAPEVIGNLGMGI